MRIEGADWTFNSDCRLVKTPDGSIVIVGGADDRGRPMRDCYHIYPGSSEILRKRSMLEGRIACAAIYKMQTIYVIGGQPRLVTCEKYSLVDDNWTPFANLNQGRWNATACLTNNDDSMYVVGGLPDYSSRNIERYNFGGDFWENIDLLLPDPLMRPCLFNIDANKMAIFGASMVQILETERVGSNAPGRVHDEIIRLF